jgi:hypothetical protein
MQRLIGPARISIPGCPRRERQGRGPPGLEFFALDRACERLRAKACRCYKKHQQVCFLVRPLAAHNMCSCRSRTIASGEL